MNWKKKLATCTLLAALATGITYIINKFIYFVATLDNLLSNPDGNYYEWRFGKIYYTKKGEGEPILLIHDLASSSSGYEWNKVEEKLAKANTVYTIDLLGCGRSDKPNLTYTNYLYVQLITDFIKHVIENKTDIITTGESSSFVLLACNNDKEIINKIILTNPSSLVSMSKIPTKRTKALKFLIYIPVIGTLLYNILTTKRKIDLKFQTEYFNKPENIDANLIKAYYESAHIHNARPKYLFASMKGKYTTANIMHCLPSIDNSVFIFTGDGNQENKLIAEQYKDYTPSIEIISIANAKHLPQLEYPKQFTDQVSLVFELGNSYSNKTEEK